MKADIHPTWYPEARVTCACGNTWTTGSTVPEIRTDVCAACHPFYTGEQRIVDTEGQVDRFLKRLKAREDILTAEEQRKEAEISPDLLITELEIGARYEKVLAEAGITTAGDALERLTEDGDEGLLSVKGFGEKGLTALKTKMRQRGYGIP